MTPWNGFDEDWLKEYQAKHGLKPRALPQPAAPAPKSPRGGRGKATGHSAGVPNKTENKFAMEQLPLIQPSLDELKFEPFTLRFELDGVTKRYTPDWVTWLNGQISCYETKGSQRDSRDSQLLYRLAKVNFPMFHFEAWRYKDRRWVQIWT